MTFDETTRDLLDGRSFATVATPNPDRAPQTSEMWIDRDGETAVSSATRRAVARITPRKVNTFAA